MERVPRAKRDETLIEKNPRFRNCGEGELAREAGHFSFTHQPSANLYNRGD